MYGVGVTSENEESSFRMRSLLIYYAVKLASIGLAERLFAHCVKTIVQKPNSYAFLVLACFLFHLTSCQCHGS